ncbi:unnamed protein product, partial [Toxocara canis]|uniref:Anaphase-promoting complex subunit 1 n=1 Tax=Toxocara canis TaxID=6265 RepID=A0A183VFS1_TOXCA
MAHSFGEVELVFAAGYAQMPSRTVRISGECYSFGLPYFSHLITVIYGALRSLDSDEAQSSAGCFDFGEETPFKDRFIIWRARGANLDVEERSVECDLMSDTSLCVNFARAHIVPGTQFNFANGKLVFVVPTQTAIHRFFIQMPKEEPSGVKRSFISQLEEQTPLSLYHDSYELSTQGCVSRAAIMHNTMDVTENVIMSDGFLHRMMKSDSDRVVAALAPCTVGGQVFFYVLFADARLRVYSKTGKVFSDSLPSLFGCDPADGGDA